MFQIIMWDKKHQIRSIIQEIIPTVHIKQSNLFYISTVVNADDYKQIVQ